MNAPTAGESAATETHVYLPSDDFVRNATIAGMVEAPVRRLKPTTKGTGDAWRGS
jgi:hypothetical protein